MARWETISLALQTGLTVYKTMVKAIRKARKVRKQTVASERKEKRGKGFERISVANLGLGEATISVADFGRGGSR